MWVAVLEIAFVGMVIVALILAAIVDWKRRKK